MPRTKQTATKKTGLPPRHFSFVNKEKVSSMSTAKEVKSPNPNPKASTSVHQSITPSHDVTPKDLQIRQVELMEEQCDSLEKLVEIASERRDIEKEILEIKKRKLAILEKNNED